MLNHQNRLSRSQVSDHRILATSTMVAAGGVVDIVPSSCNFAHMNLPQSPSGSLPSSLLPQNPLSQNTTQQPTLPSASNTGSLQGTSETGVRVSDSPAPRLRPASGSIHFVPAPKIGGSRGGRGGILLRGRGTGRRISSTNVCIWLIEKDWER